jgi:hypothetical protein
MRRSAGRRLRQNAHVRQWLLPLRRCPQAMRVAAVNIMCAVADTAVADTAVADTAVAGNLAGRAVKTVAKAAGKVANRRL